jgi:hypothetical protein
LFFPIFTIVWCNSKLNADIPCTSAATSMSAHSLCHTHTHTTYPKSSPMLSSPKILKTFGYNLSLSLLSHTHTLSLFRSIRNSVLPPARARLSFLSLSLARLYLFAKGPRREGARGQGRWEGIRVWPGTGYSGCTGGDTGCEVASMWRIAGERKKSGTCCRQRFFLVRNIAEMRELNNKREYSVSNIHVFLEK